MNTYDVGDQVRLSLALATSAGAAVDPTTLTLVVKPSTGAATTYTYAAGTITKATTGSYYVDVTATAAGVWYYKWTATGTAIGMQQGAFGVRTDQTT